MPLVARFAIVAIGLALVSIVETYGGLHPFVLGDVATLSANLAADDDSRLPIIDTSLGPVQGIQSPYRAGITVYRGIPFAATTEGSNRWKPPQQREPWTETLVANTFGPQCAQVSSSTPSIFNIATNASSEDCLYLNIWTPTYNNTSDIKSKNLPVYLWIYGGRFTGGAGNVLTYDGDGLAANDITVVTINYRLGPFGFLAHPDLSSESAHNSSGNYGLLDQQYALKWIKDNIQNFGGNSSHIVVGGQSAGSASALDMMWSPLSRDYIAGVIAESGARGVRDPLTGSVATSYRKKAVAEAQGVDFVHNLNVSSIDELRQVSMDELLEYDNLSDTTFEGTQFENLTETFAEPPLWRPVVDGYVLTHSYGEALRLNDHADVPILTGNNKDESGASVDPGQTVSSYKTVFAQMFQDLSDEFFALYPATNDTEANQSTNDLFRDLSRVGTWTWALDWAAGGAKSPVYTYYWTHGAAEDSDMGAYHGSELWYVFNNIPYASYDNATWPEESYAIEKQMAGYWTNFIKNLDPNGDRLVDFPASGETAETMWLGDSWGGGPVSDSAERISFIQKWYSTLQEW